MDKNSKIKKFDIIEKYLTINGEAPSAGDPVFLIRFSCCNMSCFYCDTKYKDEINERLTIEALEMEIVSMVNQYPGVSILLTGGEPLLGIRKEMIVELIKNNPTIKFFIETNGSIDITGLQFPNCFLVLDWKTPSSGFKNSFIENNISLLRKEKDCIKFVVSDSDLAVVRENISRIKKINSTINIYLSPQWGKISLEVLSDFILTNKLNVSLSLQYHKIIWGDRRGV